MKDPRVDEYIASLPAWQQDCCALVREVVHQADPEITETIKRNWPFFVRNGNVCALQATKDHVNILIYDPIASDPKGIINQGQGNATARAVQVYRQDKLDTDGLLQLIKAVVANDKAGGWRHVQKQL